MIEITKQGSPKIGGGWSSVFDGDTCKAAQIDLATKRCQVLCIGSDGDNVPNLRIVTTEGTPGYTEDDLSTELSFPSLKNWRVHSVMCARYTLYVCFAKNNVKA